MRHRTVKAPEVLSVPTVISVEERITRARARLHLVSESLSAQNQHETDMDLERLVEGIEQVVLDCLEDLNAIDLGTVR